ncbi:conjugal transfer protein TrbI, partial [Salmonella enterica subsp. enterica serovar Mbandaka]|nr:conjugal transfer protein TrbI [Salmonella enterica subsp. enterica serovar Mbandaka]
MMISGINSDLPGQIIGQVREAVYDSATSTQCLIPPGSRLVGTYDSGVTLGQQRALAVWRRIIYPDGSSISIDNMPGADVGGYAGFNDLVNNHYARIFGSGLLLSVFSAGIQLSQPQASNGENYSSSQIIAGSLGQQMGQIGMQMAQRNMNIQPTLEIRPGYEFNIMVTKDI